MSSDLPDIHVEKPEIQLSIDWAGIKGYMAHVRICSLDCRDHLLVIDARVNLPNNLRGVHMSRFIDAIRGEASREHDSIRGFLISLADKLLILHNYAERVYVKAKTTLLHRELYVETTRTLITGGDGFRRETLKISFHGITLCPCLQNVYSYLEKTPLEKSPSHMQRARITVRLTGPEIPVDPGGLVDAVAPAFSALPRGRLKRLEEYMLVKEALHNPRFVEDAARYAAALIAETYNDKLPPETLVYVKIVSHESIHPYDTVAIIQSRLREILEKASRGKS